MNFKKIFLLTVVFIIFGLANVISIIFFDTGIVLASSCNDNGYREVNPAGETNGITGTCYYLCPDGCPSGGV